MSPARAPGRMIADDGRTLHLRLRVDDTQAIDPGDFASVFRCGEELNRSVVEQEARRLFDFLELPQYWGLATLQDLHQLGRRTPVPAGGTDIARGSWLARLTANEGQ